jgi:hypothetical protein
MSSSPKRLIRTLSAFTDLPVPIVNLLASRAVVILECGGTDSLFIEPSVRVPLFGLLPDLGVHRRDPWGGHEKVVLWDDVRIGLRRRREGRRNRDRGHHFPVDRVNGSVLNGQLGRCRNEYLTTHHSEGLSDAGVQERGELRVLESDILVAAVGVPEDLDVLLVKLLAE